MTKNFRKNFQLFFNIHGSSKVAKNIFKRMLEVLPLGSWNTQNGLPKKCVDEIHKLISLTELCTLASNKSKSH